jgi:GNAT superfamily N-acetyltransferase
VNLFDPIEFERDEFTISTDTQKLNVDAVYEFLTETYWAKGRPRELVERSIKHSLNFGLYHGDEQIGFARVVSDFATFAYLGDVYVTEDYQGRGLGKWLVQTVLDHPKLQNLRRWMLATLDAHELYAQFGFEPLADPKRFMNIFKPYQDPNHPT